MRGGGCLRSVGLRSMPDAQIAKHGFRKPLFVERDGLNPATPDKIIKALH